MKEELTIQEIVQDWANKYALENWAQDECKPEFIVSLFQNKLIITVKHNGNTFSEELFPVSDTTFGLEPLTEIMEHLYNRTM